MKKSHVTDEGEKVCVAETRESCTAKLNGEPSPHFKSMKEGREFFVAHLAAENPDSMQNKTQRKSRGAGSIRKTSGRRRKLPTATELGFSSDHSVDWTYDVDERFIIRGSKAFIGYELRKEEILEKLTQEQRDAVELYMADDNYAELNDYLRASSFEKQKMGPKTCARLKKLSESLSEILEQNSNGLDKVVFRGVKGNFAQQIGRLPVGSKLKMSGFTSTSSSPGFARDMFTDLQDFRVEDLSDVENTDLEESFPDMNSDGAPSVSAYVQFEMRTKSGMFLSGQEVEHLLPQDTKWVVVGKRFARPDVLRKGSPSSLMIQVVEESLLEDLSKSSGSSNSAGNWEGSQ